MRIKKRKKQQTEFRKVNDWLHLWLGLVSGIIVFIISITGCFYAFQQEIRDITEPWRFVEERNESFVPPSRILDTAAVYMPGQRPTGLTYGHRGEAAAVGYVGRTAGKATFAVVFINPYTGEFIKKQTPRGGDEFHFFNFVLDGHQALWLPSEIGKPIVGIATLVFVVLLVTGIVMWWPKRWSKANRDKSFKIKLKGSFKRVNYDLHNVLGFYSLIFAFVLAVTGLVWSFTWFDKAVYYVFSGGEIKQGHHHPHSDLSNKNLPWRDTLTPLDRAWYTTLETADDINGMYMTPYPADDDDPIDITVYHLRGQWYDHSEYFYDRYTLAPLEMEGSTYRESSFADQLSMMNYDIHVGSIGGLAGKIFAFLISLICASLPITGFLVWWNKKKKFTPARVPC